MCHFPKARFRLTTAVVRLQIFAVVRPKSASLTLAAAGRTTYWVKIQCDAAIFCIVRPSVKGAIQMNAIIWSGFYCRTQLVSRVGVELDLNLNPLTSY